MKSIKNWVENNLIRYVFWIENNLIRYVLWKDPSDDGFMWLLIQLGDIEYGGYFYTFTFCDHTFKRIRVYKRTINHPYDASRVKLEEYIPVMKKLYPKLARQIFFRLHLFQE